MNLSIIIPSFNTKQLLRECLSSVVADLAKLPARAEIIVVDNASKDGSRKMVRQEFPAVKLIANQNNQGFAKANNKAASLAQGEYLLFLNSDIKVLDGAIGRLYQFVSRNIEVEIAGGKLLNPDNSPQPSCGPLYSLPVVFAMLFLRGDRWGLTRYSPARVKRVDWVSGACLLISKKAFEKIGRFDEKIFMYMDEIELFYRAKQLGYIVYFYPAARFIHYGAASSQGKQEPILNIYRGLLYFYKKHQMGAALFVLQLMLVLKAAGGYCCGMLTHNKRLQTTYGKAMRQIVC